MDFLYTTTNVLNSQDYKQDYFIDNSNNNINNINNNNNYKENVYKSFVTDPNSSNTILFVTGGFLITSFLIITIILFIMLYCCSKHRNTYKSASKELASFTFSTQSSLNSSLIGSVLNNNSDTTTSNCLNSSIIINTNNNNNNNNSNSNSNNNNNNNNNLTLSTTITKTPLKEISISLPIAKPSINESKPQLSIESKIKSKSLFESKTLYNKRRGSNNSLTLTLAPIKKKNTINSPSKEHSTLEYLTKESKPLNIEELVNLTKSNINLYHEFYRIPFNHAELLVHGSSIKNRYKTIVPNESTRVKLPIRNNDPLSSYINANYICGYKNEPKSYIASQGPMSNTLNDFWFMIWTESVSSIVMITKLFERNKNKCELYLPEKLYETAVFDNIKVTLQNIDYYQDYEVRRISVNHNNETRILYHYWYTAWPDHNLPENPNALIQLIKQIESTQKYDHSLKGPVLVHCSAGVGRTGCYLAISIGIKQLDNENEIDIFQIVCRLRKERGGMIQTLEQYEFIYQVLAYYSMYYKQFPLMSTSSCSPTMSLSPPSSSCIKTSETTTSSFHFATPTI